MHTHTHYSLAVIGALTMGANGALSLDFGNGLVEDGFVAFETPQEAAGTGALQSFGTSFANTGAATVDVSATWPNTASLAVRNSIVRGTGNNATWTGATGQGLVQDWLGSDTRAGNGNWDGTTGTPTFLNISLGNLPAGEYSWTSYHHDTENIHTFFSVAVDTGGGLTVLADGYGTDGSAGGSPDSETDGSPGRAFDFDDMEARGSIYRTTFVADGTNDVTLQFAPYSGAIASSVHNQFFFINGFELEQVPEPGTSLLSVIGVVVLGLRRKR